MNNKIFGIHDPVGLRYLFQLSLSPLRSHKFRHNFTDTPSEICRCNQGIEDTNHFFFSCNPQSNPNVKCNKYITEKQPELFRKSIAIVLIWTSINKFH